MNTAAAAHDEDADSGLVSNGVEDGSAASSSSTAAAAAADAAAASAAASAAAAAAEAATAAAAASAAIASAPPAHVGASLPRLASVAHLFRFDGEPVHSDVAEAHASLLRGLDELDTAIGSPDSALHSVRHVAGLYQQLLQELFESALWRYGRHYAAPGHANNTLQAYWAELLSSIVARRWWPQMIARLHEQGPPAPPAQAASSASSKQTPSALFAQADLSALLACANVLPVPLSSRLLTRAILDVSALPASLVTVLKRVRILTDLLKDAAAAADKDDADDNNDNDDAGASKDASAATAREVEELLQLSMDSLRTLMSTRTPSQTDGVRDLAVVGDDMLRAVEELTEACVRTRALRDEAATAARDGGGKGPILTALASLAGSGEDNVIANQMLACASSNPAAWNRWKRVVARFKHPLVEPTPLPKPAPAPALAPYPPAPVKVSANSRHAAAPTPAAPPSAASIAAAAAASKAASGHLPAAFVSNLSNELLQWFHARALNSAELVQRDELLGRLERMLQSLDPSLRAAVFGSAASRTAMKGSDMDVAIFTSGGKVVSPANAFVKKLVRAVFNAGSFIKVQPILHARVPIIKLTDRRTGIAVDLSFGQASTPYKSRLLRAYTEHDVRVPQLIGVVKHWANSRDLNDASQGTLNSFGWALLVIQYLQMLQPPILPSLQQQSEDIRREESKADLDDKLAQADPQDVVAAGVKSTASDEPQSPFIPSVTLRDPHLPRFHASSPDERVWMRGDNNNAVAAADSTLGSPAVPSSSSSPQLGALFIGFLHFYAHVFSADAHVVNIRAGGLCPRSSWAGSHRFTSGAAAGLCIVDPFDLSDNGK